LNVLTHTAVNNFRDKLGGHLTHSSWTTLKMGAANTSKTLAHIHQFAQGHILED